MVDKYVNAGSWKYRSALDLPPAYKRNLNELEELRRKHASTMAIINERWQSGQRRDLSADLILNLTQHHAVSAIDIVRGIADLNGRRFQREIIDTLLALTEHHRGGVSAVYEAKLLRQIDHLCRNGMSRLSAISAAARARDKYSSRVVQGKGTFRATDVESGGGVGYEPWSLAYLLTREYVREMDRFHLNRVIDHGLKDSEQHTETVNFAKSLKHLLKFPVCSGESNKVLAEYAIQQRCDTATTKQKSSSDLDNTITNHSTTADPTRDDLVRELEMLNKIKERHARSLFTSEETLNKENMTLSEHVDYHLSAQKEAELKIKDVLKRLKLKSEWLVQPLQVLISLKESTTEITKAFDTLLKSDEDVKRAFKEQVHLLEIMGYNEQPGDLSDLPDDEQMEDLDINLILQDDEETMKKLHEQASVRKMKERNEYLTNMYNEDLPTVMRFDDKHTCTGYKNYLLYVMNTIGSHQDSHKDNTKTTRKTDEIKIERAQMLPQMPRRVRRVGGHLFKAKGEYYVQMNCRQRMERNLRKAHKHARSIYKRIQRSMRKDTIRRIYSKRDARQGDLYHGMIGLQRCRVHREIKETVEQKNAQQAPYAVTIQSAYRGHMTRRMMIRALDFMEEALESIMDCDQAASIIQCKFRGFLARKATAIAKRVNDRQDWTN